MTLSKTSKCEKCGEEKEGTFCDLLPTKFKVITNKEGTRFANLAIHRVWLCEDCQKEDN